MTPSTYDVLVSAIVDETADTRTFELAADPALSSVLAHKAGQYLSVHVKIDGEVLKRQYSISGNRFSGDPLQITVKRVPGGIVSNWLLDHVVVSQRLTIDPPAGRFVLAEGNGNVLLLGAGAGVTPLFALAGDALFHTKRPVRMLFANRKVDSIIFKERLSKLEDQFESRFTLTHHLSRNEGRITSSRINQFRDEALSGDVYVCGPSGFNEIVEECFAQSSSNRFRLFLESFGTPLTTTPQEVGSTSESETGSMIVAKLNGKYSRFEGNYGSSILESALLKSLQLPHSCREGRCGTCLAKVTSGKVSLSKNAALSLRERAAGFILTCQARPRSEQLEIDLDV
jgi:ferredoxin-NADP reductase